MAWPVGGDAGARPSTPGRDKRCGSKQRESDINHKPVRRADNYRTLPRELMSVFHPLLPFRVGAFVGQK